MEQSPSNGGKVNTSIRLAVVIPLILMVATGVGWVRSEAARVAENSLAAKYEVDITTRIEPLEANREKHGKYIVDHEARLNILETEQDGILDMIIEIREDVKSLLRTH